MIDKERIMALTEQIKTLLEEENFTETQAEIIRLHYLSDTKKVDIRRLARKFHKPMKYIEKDYQKAERKLFNLLKQMEE